MMQGFQNLYKPVGQMVDIGAAAWQNELNRKLQRELPDIQAEANIHQLIGTEREKYLGRRGAEAVPGEPAPGAPTPPEVAPPAYDFKAKLEQFSPGFKEPEGAVGPVEETATGQEFPFQIAERLTGDREKWRGLIFKDKAGNNITEQVLKLAKKQKKVPEGVIVDYSAIGGNKTSGSDMYQQFMEKNKLTPETYKEPAMTPLEVPENIKMPEKTAAKEEPLVKSLSKYGEGLPAGWLAESEMIAMQPEIAKAKETDVFKMRRAEAAKEHPEMSSSQLDWEATRRTFGWPPIDYRDKGANYEDERKKKIEGSLSNLVGVEGGNWLGTPDGRAYFDRDPNGGYAVKEGSNVDEGLAKLADVIARRSEPGVSRTQFYHFTERGDWKKYMDNIQNPPEGMTKEDAIARWRDEVIIPYLRDELSTKGVIGKEEPAKGADLGAVGDTLSFMTPLGPIKEVVSGVKSGFNMPTTEKDFLEKYNSSAQFRQTMRLAGVGDWLAYKKYANQKGANIQ